MFKDLNEKLNKIFSKLTGVGYLNEEQINNALREIRIALLEADVAVEVVREFTNIVKEKALGQEVLKSITPGQMVVKIVQDCMVDLLTFEGGHELNIGVKPPAVILMLGLQGSGKTTTTAKIAKRLSKDFNKKILLASLDIYRPAAQEQLKILAEKIGVDCVDIIAKQKPVEITQRALKQAKTGLYDVLILDTAGRLHIDDELMNEVIEISQISRPSEKLLVVDAMTGQDSVNVAHEFNNKVGISGIVLTRIDGDARGGAALSMSYVTKCPIKFLGSGEAIEELEVFYPDRIASRILGMGDVVSLVEKAAEIVDEEESEKLERSLKKGSFDLDQLANQLSKIRKMGGMSKIMGMIPGMGKFSGAINQDEMSEKTINRQIAIINSMTKLERKNPKLLNASRKIRIAKGSGVQVQEVNKLIKNFLKMQKMFKRFGSMDKKALMRGGLEQFLS
jgi:signal recognition particle subunit SRP54